MVLHTTVLIVAFGNNNVNFRDVYKVWEDFTLHDNAGLLMNNRTQIILQLYYTPEIEYVYYYIY